MSLEPKEHFSTQQPSIKYIVGLNKNLGYNEVVYIIRSILKDLREILTMELELWIDEKVPKRTGQLREDLKENLHESHIVEHILHVVLGTTIDYAEKVSEMSTSQVRHHGETGYVYYYNPFGIRGKVILEDPQAIGNFWTHLVEYALERAHINIAKLKAKYSQITNISMRDLSELKINK